MNRLCLKIPYATEESALRALEDAAHDHRGKPKVEKRVYLCVLCRNDAWHLTSQRARR